MTTRKTATIAAVYLLGYIVFLVGLRDAFRECGMSWRRAAVMALIWPLWAIAMMGS